MKKILIAILLLILTVSVYAASRQTSSTLASAIITRARYHLNEATADFWSDAELLVWVNEGSKDIAGRTRCLEESESVTILANTVEYSITDPYTAVTTVVYNDPNGVKKGLIRKNPQSVGHSKDTTPSFWYEWDGSVGIFPAPKIVTDANLGIGTTATNVATEAFSYFINEKVYTKAAVAAGTAPGDDVIPTAEYGAVAFDIGSDGTIDAVEAYANAAGYTTAALAISGLPQVAKGHVRLGTVTATKSDGAFTFGTTDLDAANVTDDYVDSTPAATVYYISGPAGIASNATVLLPAVYDRALVLYVAAQALLKKGSYAKSGRLMAEYYAELDRYRSDFIDVPREPEGNVTR